MANDDKSAQNSDDLDFERVKRELLLTEIRLMITRLQSSGTFQLSVSLDELDLRGLAYIKRQLRDTLRTLGGGR